MDIREITKLLGLLAIAKEANAYTTNDQPSATTDPGSLIWLPPNVTPAPNWVPNNLGQLFIPQQKAAEDTLSITSVPGGTVVNIGPTHIWTGDPQTNTDGSVIAQGGIVYVAPSTTILIGPGGYGTIAVPPGATLPTPLIPTPTLTSATTFTTLTVKPTTTQASTTSTGESPPDSTSLSSSTVSPTASSTGSLTQPSLEPRKKVGAGVDNTERYMDWLYTSDSESVDTISHQSQSGQGIDHPALKWAYSPSDIESLGQDLDDVSRDYQRNFDKMLNTLPHPSGLLGDGFDSLVIATDGEPEEWTQEVQEKYTNFTTAIKDHIENHWGKNVTVIPPLRSKNLTEISDTQIDIQVIVNKNNTNKCAFDQYTSGQRGGNLTINPDVTARDFYDTLWQGLNFGADTRSADVQEVRNQLFNFNGDFSLADQAFVNLMESRYKGLGFALASRNNYEASSGTQNANLTDDRQAEIKIDPIIKKTIPLPNYQLGIMPNFEIGSKATSQRFQVASSALIASAPVSDEPPFSALDDIVSMRSMGQVTRVDLSKSIQEGLSAFKLPYKQIVADGHIERGGKELIAYPAAVGWAEASTFMAALIGTPWIRGGPRFANTPPLFTRRYAGATLGGELYKGFFLNTAAVLLALGFSQKTSTGLPAIAYATLSEFLKPRYYQAIGDRSAYFAGAHVQKVVKTLAFLKAVADLPFTAASTPAWINYVAEGRPAKGLIFPLAISATIQLLAFAGRKKLMPMIASEDFKTIYENLNRSIWQALHKEIRDYRHNQMRRQLLEIGQNARPVPVAVGALQQGNGADNNPVNDLGNTRNAAPLTIVATTSSDHRLTNSEQQTRARTIQPQEINPVNTNVLSPADLPDSLQPNTALPVLNMTELKNISSSMSKETVPIGLTLSSFMLDKVEIIEALTKGDISTVSKHFSLLTKAVDTIKSLSNDKGPEDPVHDLLKPSVELLAKMGQISMAGVFLHEWGNEEKLSQHINEKILPQVSECCQQILEYIVPELYISVVSGKKTNDTQIQATIDSIANIEKHSVLDGFIKSKSDEMQKIVDSFPLAKAIDDVQWGGRWAGNTNLAGATVLIKPGKNNPGALLKFHNTKSKSDQLIYVTHEDYDQYLVPVQKSQGHNKLVTRVEGMSKEWKPSARVSDLEHKRERSNSESSTRRRSQ